MSRSIGRQIFAAVLISVAMGNGLLTGAQAWAQAPIPPAAKPPAALADAVRAAINDTAKPATAPASPAASAAGASEPGIALSGAASALSPLEAEQLEIERQAEEAAARAAADQAKREVEHNKKSYKKAAQGLLPLSDEQIRAFMQKLEQSQEASQPPSTGTPKGEIKVVGLSLDPGGMPPEIRLAAGFVTTISVVDQTGEPWPILDVGVGGNFEVTPTQAGSHVVRVVPLTRLGTGNLSILLKDLATPVIFRLTAGEETFHMRYDARVPELGPNARTPLIERRRPGLVAGDSVISMILENAPPKEARRVKVGGLDARTMAWRLGEKLYVRTPLTMLSPAWNASASSADGMTVYEVGDAPVLLMSDNGAMVRARILQDDGHGK